MVYVIGFNCTDVIEAFNLLERYGFKCVNKSHSSFRGGSYIVAKSPNMSEIVLQNNFDYEYNERFEDDFEIDQIIGYISFKENDAVLYDSISSKNAMKLRKR